MIPTFLKIVIVAVWTLSIAQLSHAEIDDIYQQQGIAKDRLGGYDESGTENIDTFTGRLNLSYTDSTMPGTGGFDIPIIRRYDSQQAAIFDATDPTNSVYGFGWDIHFGRIKLGSELHGYCNGSFFNFNTESNPIFEDMAGSRSLLVVTNESSASAGDMTSAENHRVLCHDDDTISVTTSSGMTYFFGKQAYIKRGSGLPIAGEGESLPVTFASHRYATELRDKNGNMFSIEYSMHNNANAELNRSIFTIDRVLRDGIAEVATFEYTDAQGTGSNSSSPYALLTGISVNRTKLQYSYEINNSFVPATYQLVSVETTGANPVTWKYEYFPFAFPNLESNSLKKVTNPYGGETHYTYQYIRESESGGDNGLVAISTKYLSGYNKGWTYTFDGGESRPGYDTTTVISPDDSKTEYVHCNASGLEIEQCAHREGVLVEKALYGVNPILGEVSGTASSIEYYQWNLGDTISDQKRLIRAFGASAYNITDNGYKRKHLVQTSTEVDGLFYTKRNSSFDEYGYPEVVNETVTSSLPDYYTFTYSTARTIQRSIEYDHKVGNNWQLGLVTSQVIDSFGQEPGDHSVTSDYDDYGNQLSNNVNGVVTSYTYDNNGNVTSITDPNSNVTEYANYRLGVPRIVKQSVDLSGAPQTTYTQEVDEHGLVTKRALHLARAQIETEYKHDTLNRLIEIVTPEVDSDITIDWGFDQKTVMRGNRIQVSVFDNHGRMVREKLGAVETSSRYDTFGRLVFQSLPDVNIASIANPAGAISRYDELSRLVQVENTADGSITEYSYDADTSSYQSTVNVKDSRNNTTTYTYRSFGSPNNKQLMAITQPEGVNTVFTRTLLGHVRSVEQGSVTRLYTYDSKYRVETIYHPDIGIRRMTFDNGGNMVTSVTVSNKGVNSSLETSGETLYEYDGRNRLTRINYPDVFYVGNTPSPDVMYEYYNDDLVSTVSKGESSWEYFYNDNRNLTREELNIDADIFQSYTIAYGYDDKDVVSSITYPSGLVVDYSPDELGRPTKVGDFINSVTYHPNGRQHVVTYANGHVVTNALNERQLLENIGIEHNQISLADETYLYDSELNVTDVSGVVHPSQVFTYDKINRLSTRTLHGESYQYGYDVLGNITDKSVPEIDLSFGQSYDYNSAGRLQSVTGMTSNRTYDMQYDVYGNIVSDGRFTYNFDDASNLTEIGETSVLDESAYDGNGLRYQTKRGRLALVSLYNRDRKLIYDVTPIFGETTEYIYLGTSLVARRDEVVPVDTDGDGITNREEGLFDFDNDGVPDYLDLDSDNDGISDAIEGSEDDDNDDLPNRTDTDSDGDGKFDVDESLVAQLHCTDNSHYDDVVGMVALSVDPASGTKTFYWNINEFSSVGLPSRPFEGDDRYYDYDGDGINNEIERSAPRADNDCDGVPNWLDRDSDGDTWEDSLEGNVDPDADGVPNYLDTDSDSADNSGIPDILQAPEDFFENNLRSLQFLSNGSATNAADGRVHLNRSLDVKVLDELNRPGHRVAVSLDAPDDVVLTGNSGEQVFKFYTTRRVRKYDLLGDDVGCWVFEPNKSYQRLSDRHVDPYGPYFAPFILADIQIVGNVGAGPLLKPCETRKVSRIVTEIEVYTFEIDIPVDSQDRTLVYTVEERAGADGTVGKLTFVRAMDGVTIPPDIKTGKEASFRVEEPVYVLSDTYQSTSNYLVVDEADEIPGPFGSFCCTTSIDTNGNRILYQLTTIDDSTTGSSLNQIGRQFIVQYVEYFFGDRALSDIHGVVLQDGGAGGGLDNFYVIENFLDITEGLQPGQPPRSLTLVFEVATLAAGGSDPASIGTVTFVGFVEEDDGLADSDVPLSPSESLLDDDPRSITVDSDSDGIPDYIEVVIPELPVDTDNDGTPDYLDTDSDNDGINDSFEAQFSLLDPVDSDGSGTPDYRDIDSDNDTILDIIESNYDPDSDQLPNYIDVDSDGDFIADIQEVRVDAEGNLLDLDQDGLPDYLDRDSDGDNVGDEIEVGQFPDSPLDTDGDGMPDYLDEDSDNDGISDADENAALLDTDEDGIPDDVELSEGLDPNNALDASADLDGDGLSNLQEHVLGTSISVSDTDSDGIPDGFESAAGSDPLTDDANSDLDGDGISNLSEFLNPLTIGNVVHRINVGGPEIVTDNGKWTEDTDVMPSAFSVTGDIGSSESISGLDVKSQAFTPPVAIFSHYREASSANQGLSWRLPGGDGVYEVRLYFAETNSSAFSSGSRLQQITLEDTIVNAELDIYTQASGNVGTVVSHVVNVVDNVDLLITSANSLSILSGIEVIVADPSRLPVEPGDEGNETTATLINVNDWFNASYGGGFIATYRYPLTDVEVPLSGSIPWRIDFNYDGPGTITNAYMSGFNGQVSYGSFADDGGMAITNASFNYKPQLSAGMFLQFSVHVNDAGFDVADFTPTFINLSSDTAEPEAPSDPLPENATITLLNSWYDPAFGGGYQARLRYELRADDLMDASDHGWTLDIGYSGTGMIQSGYINGFNGPVDIDRLSDSAIRFSNEQVGYQPTLSVGDTLTLTVQIEGAAFTAGDFSISFTQ